MPSIALVDAGPLIALFDRSDVFHEQVFDLLRSTTFRLFTTSAVIAEATHILDFSVTAQLRLFEWLSAGGVGLLDLRTEDWPRVIALTEKYRDLPMNFADATLVIAAEHSGIRDVISIDSDFAIYRIAGKTAFRNLLAPK